MISASPMTSAKTPYPVDGSDSKTPEDCVRLYDDWATTYDRDVRVEQYRGPELLAEVCLEFLEDKEARILDLLCGTGADARLLTARGFRNVDGIDGSEKMLAQCRSLGLYRKLMGEILQPNQPSKLLNPASYDALIAVGVFAPGHTGPDYLNHFYEPVKKGGLIIFGIREPWLNELALPEKLKTLETAGVWRLMERVKKDDYRRNVPGVFFVYQRM